jgi:hypothetical protein
MAIDWCCMSPSRFKFAMAGMPSSSDMTYGLKVPLIAVLTVVSISSTQNASEPYLILLDKRKMLLPANQLDRPVLRIK